jgi:hypothetical protein
VVKAAHDFNNVLSVITGHAAILERSGADPFRRMDSVQRIQRACAQGEEIVKQLLVAELNTDAARDAKNVGNHSREIPVSQTRDVTRKR